MTFFKKWIAVLLVLIAFLPSCTINETHKEYMNSFSWDYTVYQQDWDVGKDDDSGNYFFYEFKVPQLTQYVYDNGVMQAFLRMNGDNLSPLPFDDFWYIDAFKSYDRTEHVTCEFRPGYITFILKYSDHSLDTPYYDYKFRVRFMW